MCGCASSSPTVRQLDKTASPTATAMPVEGPSHQTPSREIVETRSALEIAREELLAATRDRDADRVAVILAEVPAAAPHSNAPDRPIDYAATYDDPAILRLLLDVGVDPTAAGADLLPPLHLAAMWGRATNVTLLLEAGAPVDQRVTFQLAPNSPTNNPQHCTSRPRMVTQLLRKHCSQPGQTRQRR